jgi:hypothetical protein
MAPLAVGGGEVPAGADIGSEKIWFMSLQNTDVAFVLTVVEVDMSCAIV